VGVARFPRSAYDLRMIYEIIVDSGETPNKCTIAPLSYRSDFHLFDVWGEGPLGPLSAPILLHHEGACLTEIRNTSKMAPALASVDCVWRRLPKLINRIEWINDSKPILVKIPPGFKTVYPRTGRPNADPSEGLATIEAIFIATSLLGNWDPTLLAHYYFGREFVELNANRFLDLGVSQAAAPNQIPTLALKARDSLRRRINRGRMPK
jgi:pre-rRNA-processing protein TSR3